MQNLGLLSYAGINFTLRYLTAANFDFTDPEDKTRPKVPPPSKDAVGSSWMWPGMQTGLVPCVNDESKKVVTHKFGFPMLCH